MSTFSKAVYLGFILPPVVLLFSMFACDLYKETWALQGYISSFRWTMLYFLISFIYTIAYFRHLYKNQAVSDKTIWYMGLLFMSLPVRVLYCWRWIRMA